MCGRGGGGDGVDIITAEISLLRGTSENRVQSSQQAQYHELQYHQQSFSPI